MSETSFGPEDTESEPEAPLELSDECKAHFCPFADVDSLAQNLVSAITVMYRYIDQQQPVPMQVTTLFGELFHYYYSLSVNHDGFRTACIRFAWHTVMSNESDPLDEMTRTVISSICEALIRLDTLTGPERTLTECTMGIAARNGNLWMTPTLLE